MSLLKLYLSYKIAFSGCFKMGREDVPTRRLSGRPVNLLRS